MNIRASKSDIIWSYFGTIFSLSSSFLLLPFIMLKLSSNELGLWYVFLAINGLVSLFDFGFDPTFARNIAYAWGGATRLKRVGAEFDGTVNEPNYYLLKLVVKTCRVLYGIISLVALVAIAIIGTPYIIYISHNLNGYNYLVAWFIFCISLFLNLYMGYYSALLRGVGAVSVINKITIFSKLSQIIVSVVLLFLGFRLIAVSLGFLSNGIVLRYLCKYGFYSYHEIGKNINLVKKRIGSKEVKQTFSVVSYNAFKDGLVAVSNYLTTQSSSIIASLFLNLTQTGIYSISLQFANAVSNVSATMINAYQPTMQSAFINKDMELERKVVAKGLSMLYILTLLGTGTVVVVIFPVLELIKPGAKFNILVFLGLSLYTFLWQQQSASAAYIANTNEVPYVKAFVVSSVVGIIFTIAGFHYLQMGIWSLIVCPGIIQILFNNWFWTKRVMNRLQVNFFRVLVKGFRYWINTFKLFLYHTRK